MRFLFLGADVNEPHTLSGIFIGKLSNYLIVKTDFLMFNEKKPQGLKEPRLNVKLHSMGGTVKLHSMGGTVKLYEGV